MSLYNESLLLKRRVFLFIYLNDKKCPNDFNNTNHHFLITVKRQQKIYHEKNVVGMVSTTFSNYPYFNIKIKLFHQIRFINI